MRKQLLSASDDNSQAYSSPFQSINDNLFSKSAPVYIRDGGHPTPIGQARQATKAGSHTETVGDDTSQQNVVTHSWTADTTGIGFGGTEYVNYKTTTSACQNY